MEVAIDAGIEPLMRAHGDRVLGLLARLLGDADDAEDVYQETWYSIWRSLPRLRPVVDPWPFIRRAAVRKAIDHVRSRRARVDLTRASDAERVATSRAASPELDLDGLRSEERACLELFFWEGCSVREIAAELGVPPGTVKTWMFRARRRLRERIETKGEPT